MPRPIFQRLGRLAAAAFLTLLATAVLPPGSARAGCVHDRPTASHFDNLVLSGAMADTDEMSPASTPGRMPTCNGPHCSRGPAAPPTSPWVASGTIRDTWACLTERLDAAASSESPLLPEATPLLPSQRGPSVFHPPRTATI